MKNEELLNSLSIASPCPVDWTQMTGDDQKRHCSLCDLHVYNISEMTRKEAAALITGSEGRICARLFRRVDGTVITRDCPVGLRAVRRKVAKTTTAVFTAILSLATMAMGQKQKAERNSCVNQLKITRKVSDSADAGTFALTILDINGASVANADVELTETAAESTSEAKESQHFTSNEEGLVTITGLKPAAYNLQIKSPGFTTFKFTQVKVSARELVNIEVTLGVITGSVTVGILVDQPGLIYDSPGTLIIRPEMLDRFPHQE
ncbi:MAG: hypothetical protein QOD75_360 [Blastocatellia bacterium]|jgi:hypothetical protein|nr:hypothetical protein [Blastocatellia bacterium]